MPTAAPIGTASFSSVAFPNPSPLLSDGDDVVSRPGTVASGIGVIVRGTIVNIDPATSAITVPTTIAGCNAILVDDIDSTAATVAAVVYVTAKVKADMLTWPGALSHSAVADQLRDYGIYVESVLTGVGTIVKSNPTEAESAEAKKYLDAARAEIKKAKEPEKPEDKETPPPADSVVGYMTADEKLNEPQLAELATTLTATPPHAKHPAHETHPSHEEKKNTPPSNVKK